MKLLSGILIYGIVSWACVEPEVINLTDSWTERDKKALSFTKQRCYEIYGLEAPCLKRFYKTGEGSYRAICGSDIKDKEELLEIRL
jgi:hypothetical protein